MIIVLKPHATKTQADEILGRIAALGLRPLYMPGTERVVLGAIGDERAIDGLRLENLPVVESVQRILAPYKLVSREMHPHDTVVNLRGTQVGGARFTGGAQRQHVTLARRQSEFCATCSSVCIHDGNFAISRRPMIELRTSA